MRNIEKQLFNIYSILIFKLKKPHTLAQKISIIINNKRIMDHSRSKIMHFIN